MTILLDSHALFWWTVDEPRLSRRAAAAIEGEPKVYISGVVAWEIANKVRTGKWPEAKLLSERLVDLMAHYGFLPLPITLAHAHLAGSMPGAHRDPFDRMLAAQAIVEGMRLVTVDPAFHDFGVEVLW